jgi:peptide/nickel transport system substrate-binding protein
MTSEQYRKEYGEHLVEQCKKGHMTRRQLLVRASVFGLSATVAGQLLAACGESEEEPTSDASAMPEPVMGGILKMIGPAPITDPNPLTIYDQGGIVLVGQFLEYLIDLNNDNSLKPKLAESWEPNETLDVWTVKLRQGVTFNDGSPFEAEDVVTSVERAIAGSSGAASQWGGGASSPVLYTGGAVATDPYTVTVNLAKPYADFPFTISGGNYNFAILPRNWGGDILAEPIGTGPFMLDQYVTKQKATFKKNPNYWGKDDKGNQLPYLDGLEYTMVEDNSAQNLQMQSGAIDVQPQTVFQGAQALFTDPNLRVDIYPGTGIREVAFNQTKEPWKSGGGALCRAVAYCLDRPAINEALYAGRSSLGYDSFWNTEAYPGIEHIPTDVPRAQDLDMVKQLLTEAGYPDGLEIELTFAKYLENPQLAQLIKDQCEAAGITVQLNQLSYSEFYAGSETDYYGTTPWIVAPMTIVEWGSRPSPGIYAAAMLLPGAVWSSSHWENQEFLDTFNQYESTLDEAERTALATTLSQVSQEDTPIMVPFFIAQARTQKKTVWNIQGPGSFYCDCTAAFKTE